MLYHGYDITTHTFEEVTIARARRQDKALLTSKRFSGSSGKRRAIAHVKRQIERKHEKTYFTY